MNPTTTPKAGAVADVAAKLTEAQRAALYALPRRNETWLTVSEMRPGSTGANTDVLYVTYFDTPLCFRRWAKWGSDRVHNQKRGEGYEYTITPLGLAVRQHLEQGATAGVVGGKERGDG